MSTTRVHFGDSREILKRFSANSINLIVTSPPYADARKKHYDSITPDRYADFLLSFSDEFYRVLKPDGSFVLNIKDKVIDGVRHRYVWDTIERLSLQGWRCVEDYIWLKPNAMPGYWRTRFRDEWEYCFHLTKGKSFYMNQKAVRKPIGDWAEKRLANLNGKSNGRHNSENESGFGRDLRNWKNKEYVLPGNVISVPLVGKNLGHPAVFPLGLPEFFIKLFSKPGDWVLDPFAGSGSTGIAAELLNRNCVLIDNKAEYIDVIEKRLSAVKAGVDRIFVRKGESRTKRAAQITLGLAHADVSTS
ncbi:MAG: site-specific DNA-methyltransferase [Candidatus Zixiibacteriota bacterium]